MAARATYDESFFTRLDGGAELAAAAVLPIVFGELRPKSVVDVGCGSGAWLSQCLRLGVEDVLGIDGAWNTVAPARLGPDRFVERDLTAELDLDRRFDLAVSIEVAEHLPPARAEYFVGDLCELADVVLFSAAIPGQGGQGHVNEAWPSYWATHFASFDFRPVDLVRPHLWNETAVPIAVRQNLLVYARDPASIATGAAPVYVDVVHPQWAEVLAGRAEQPGVRQLLRRLPGAIGRAATSRWRARRGRS